MGVFLEKIYFFYKWYVFVFVIEINCDFYLFLFKKYEVDFFY